MKFASPAPALGFGKRFLIMLGEYFAFLLTFLLVIPFERLWMPADVKVATDFQHDPDKQ